MSIGHRDTNNLVRDNDITGSGKVGVLFRPERGKAFAPHRNRIENNRIVDSGPEDGIAIDVQGETDSILLARNEIRESRMPDEAHRHSAGPADRARSSLSKTRSRAWLSPCRICERRNITRTHRHFN